MEREKADAVAEFKASQPFIDACAIYYGDGFKDCLKQVGFVYPNLDLSKVSLDDPLPMTPVAGDTIDKESDDSTHTEEPIPIDDGVVIAQPIPDGAVTLLVLSTEDFLSKMLRTRLFWMLLVPSLFVIFNFHVFCYIFRQ